MCEISIVIQGFKSGHLYSQFTLFFLLPEVCNELHVVIVRAAARAFPTAPDFSHVVALLQILHKILDPSFATNIFGPFHF